MRSVLALFAKHLKNGAWLALGTGLGVAMSVGVSQSGPQTAERPDVATQTKPSPIELVDDLRIGGAPALGSPTAPLTIVEFSDFECPYCRRFHQQVLGPLETDYISTGLVRFVHKDLPLPFHAQADLSARVARCSQDQGDYWQTYKRLFDRQACLACDGPIKIASSNPEQQDALRQCAESAQTRLLVNTDRSEAGLNGIRATPTFVIGPTIGPDRHRGRVIEGAMTWSAFKALVDKELQSLGHSIDTSSDGR